MQSNIQSSSATATTTIPIAMATIPLGDNTIAI